MPMTALGISGVHEARGAVNSLSLTDLTALRISSAPDAGRTGTATLAPIALPAGAALGVHSTDLPREYELSIQAPGAELRADVAGRLTLDVAGSPRRQVDFAVPEPIALRAGREGVDMDVTLPAVPAKPFVPQLSARDLSLFRIDEFNEGGRMLVRRVSTIISGTLFFESLGDRGRRIRPGEALEFERSSGEIRELRLGDREIRVRYHGRVRGMSTGSGEGRRSLMPTYLEWLRARHGLTLLWGSALYAFGLVAAGLRWWGIRV